MRHLVYSSLDEGKLAPHVLPSFLFLAVANYCGANIDMKTKK
jgi:hypothetical protein